MTAPTTKYQVCQNKCHAQCGWATSEQQTQVFKPSQEYDRKIGTSITAVEAAAGSTDVAAAVSATMEESAGTPKQRHQW